MARPLLLERRGLGEQVAVTLDSGSGMNAGLVLRRSRGYACEGLGFVGAILKHSLVPLPLLWRVLPERGLLLDLGCGEGMLGNLVAASRPGLRIHGVDRDRDKVALANRNAPWNARFETADILECSFYRAAAAIFNDVLHHHPATAQVDLLRKVAGFLDDDGVLVVKEVDALDGFDRVWTSFWDRRLYPADTLNFRSVQEWRGVLFEAGFQVLSVYRARHPWPASRTVLVCRRQAVPQIAGPDVSEPVRVLITGATGFIGRHLAKHLCEEGLAGRAAEVTILVRDRTRIPPELDGLCRVMLTDLESLPMTADAVREMDYVFHLAADKDFFGGKQVFVNNVRATEALIQTLRGSRALKRLVFASSMGAVDRSPGDDCTSPINEDSPPFPSSPYGRAKYECERLIAASSLPFTILRLPWCYGSGMTARTHVRALIERVMRGGIVTRFDWPGRVSLLEVGECAKAFSWAASHPHAQGATLFVTDGAPIRLGSLFQEIGRIGGRRSGHIPVPALVVSLARRCRRILPLALRSLFLDVLWVEDRRLRGRGFVAAPRTSNFLASLARFVNDEAQPSLHRSKALVTGAASGIGQALAVQLAARGRGVVMVDRDPRVVEMASQILGTEPCLADLCEETGLAKVRSRIEAGDINWVVNCAGVGVRGDVGDVDSSALGRIVATNVHALTQLSEAALRQFRAAGEGVLVNVASSAGLQPLPGMAAYSASKAYVLSFSEAVAGEQMSPGLVVITVCPSGVATGFQEAAGVRRVSGERLLSADDVAAQILRACEQRRSRTVFIGGRTFGISLAARLLPRRLNVRLWKRLMDRRR